MTRKTIRETLSPGMLLMNLATLLMIVWIGPTIIILAISLLPPMLGPFLLPLGLEASGKKKEYLLTFAAVEIIFFFSSLTLELMVICILDTHFPLIYRQYPNHFHINMSVMTFMLLSGLVWGVLSQMLRPSAEVTKAAGHRD